MKRTINHALLIGFMFSCTGSVKADASWYELLKNGFAALYEPKECVKIAAALVGGSILGVGLAYLWARHYSYKLNPSLLSGDALLDYLRAKYKPSKEKCGAAISQATDRLPDDFWAALISLVDGHRDIYWGSQADLTPAIERILNQANIGIIRFNRQIPAVFNDQRGKKYRFNDVPASGYVEKQTILYRPRGKANALLFHQYLTNLSGLNHHNDYLIGKLLGYNEKDIEYYYQTNETKKLFIHDKKEALEWLEKNRKNK